MSSFPSNKLFPEHKHDMNVIGFEIRWAEEAIYSLPSCFKEKKKFKIVKISLQFDKNWMKMSGSNSKYAKCFFKPNWWKKNSFRFAQTTKKKHPTLQKKNIFCGLWKISSKKNNSTPIAHHQIQHIKFITFSSFFFRLPIFFGYRPIEKTFLFCGFLSCLCFFFFFFYQPKRNFNSNYPLGIGLVFE